MKSSIVKSESLGRRKAYSGLLSIVTVAVVLMIATPVFAKSGFSFIFFFSDGYYKDSRVNHRHGRHINREYDRNWDYFYNVPLRHDFGRRHIHKPRLKHRHEIGCRYKHKRWRKHLNDFGHRHSRKHRSDYRKHRYFNRW